MIQPNHTGVSCAPKPRFPDDPAYHALREGRLAEYHKAIVGRESIDLTNADLRGLDLRKVDLGKAILSGAYLRDADISGQDLRAVDLEGCSLFHAKISGTFFPDDISPEEIRLSLEHGTRLRKQS